jgi:hypothetical protein
MPTGRVRAARSKTPPALAVPAGVDPFALRVRPISVRCDYLLGTLGHRMLGTAHGEQVIDTGWHPTAAKAAAAYGRALGPIAARAAARYLA